MTQTAMTRVLPPAHFAHTAVRRLCCTVNDSHSKNCWGEPWRQPRRISAMDDAFRELEEIEPKTYIVSECTFTSHIFAIWNTHYAFREFLVSFGLGSPDFHGRTVSLGKRQR